MALHQAMSTSTPAAKDKLIFAPGAGTATQTGDDHVPSQAAQFHLSRLSRSSLSPNPLTQFHTWFTSPQLAHHVPETVTLATASLPSGRVSSRIVYLKELDPRGFVIYSNFGTSRKAADLATNPYASLCFWWKPLERQVRVEGKVERLTEAESQLYFDTRARGSRIGAWASQQTSVLVPKKTAPAEAEQGNPDSVNSNGRDLHAEAGTEEEDDGRLDLESRVADIHARFEGQDQIPVPPFWGGLRIIPETVEFWQGRESRLHDRFLYTKLEGTDNWKIERLSP